jgi:murein DD-endopeptidase MepM/ murein hydrolase activator NlpD
MSPEQMAQAVVGYLQASGVRPGDPLHVIYQAIQAPKYTDQARATGRNYLSDSNGAVSAHVARMQKEYRPLAEGWLRQGAGVGGGSPYRDPRLLSAPAKRLLSQTQITSEMGFRVHPVTGGRKFHAGIDYAVGTGTKLSLKQPGIIVDIQDHGDSGYGKYVDVQFPDGSIGRFAHLSRIKARMGQRVNPNQVFALTGNTGGSTGPHLHLEKRVGDRPVDPRSLANQVYADI